MNIIERIARAIHKSNGLMISFDCLTNSQKHILKVQAIAAIKEMQKLIEEMLETN